MFRPFIDGLPDKGEKVKHLCNLIKLELEKRCNAEKLCKDLASLNIGQDQLDTFEWTGKHASHTIQSNCQPNVDDQDVLKMFVSHSGVNQDKIVIKYKVFHYIIDCHTKLAFNKHVFFQRKIGRAFD